MALFNYPASVSFAAAHIAPVTAENNCSDTLSYSLSSSPLNNMSFHEPIPPKTHALCAASNKARLESVSVPLIHRSLWYPYSDELSFNEFRARLNNSVKSLQLCIIENARICNKAEIRSDRTAVDSMLAEIVPTWRPTLP